MPAKKIPFNPTPENLREAENSIAQGYTLQSIALSIFKVSVDTFAKWRKEHPELEAALQRGKHRDEQLCMDRLREIAFNDNHKQHLTALLAYGKIKHRWNDGSRLDDAAVAAAGLPKTIPVDLDD